MERIFKKIKIYINNYKILIKGIKIIIIMFNSLYILGNIY